MLLALSRLLFAICCLRKGPQDIPKSNILSSVVLLAYTAVAFMMLYDEGSDVSVVFLEIGFEIILVMGFMAGVLFAVGKITRYQQAMTALMGTDALISFFAIPPMFAQVSGSGAEIMILVILGLMLWHWIVCGHIIRHTIDQPLSFGLGIAFLYIYGSYRLMDWFAGVIANF